MKIMAEILNKSKLQAATESISRGPNTIETSNDHEQ